ncbi:MAG: MFS transporter [Chloroflexota bacterium]|nr:MFS transporter [Chloroflexota bacterium]
MSTTAGIAPTASQPRYAWVVMAHLWGMDFVNNMVFFSLGVLVPIWREDLGLTPTQAGLLGTAGFMGFGLMALPASIWLTRYSPKLVTLFASLGMAGFTMLQAMSPGAAVLMLARLGFVICSAVRIQLQVMLIQQWFRPKLYATVNSLDYGTRSTGQVIALAATPGLVMLLGSWRSHYFFVGVLLLLVTLSWVFFGRERRVRPEGDAAGRHEPNPAGVLRRNKTMWMVATAQLGVAICFGSFLTFYPTYAIDKLDISLETAGLLMSAFPVGGVCGTLASGPLSQWAGRRKPFIIVPGIILPVAYSLLLQADSVPMAALVLFIVGLTAMGTAPILFTIPMDLRLPHREVAVAQGLMRTLFPFSAMWGPLFVGLMQEGTGSLFIGLAIVAPLNITLFINGMLMPETGIRGRLDRIRASRAA